MYVIDLLHISICIYIPRDEPSDFPGLNGIMTPQRSLVYSYELVDRPVGLVRFSRGAMDVIRPLLLVDEGPDLVLSSPIIGLESILCSVGPVSKD